MPVKRYYPAVVEKDPDSDFGIFFPDFPGCVSAGDTAEDAIARGTEALTAHIAWMVRDGDPLPDPTPIAEVSPDSDVEAVCLTLVPVTLPGRAKRINVTLDENLIAEIDAVSANRSGFLSEAAVAELARRRRGAA